MYINANIYRDYTWYKTNLCLYMHYFSIDIYRGGYI